MSANIHTQSADVLVCQCWNDLTTDAGGQFCVCVCVCVCVWGHVYVVYEDTNLYNDMGIT